MGSARACIAAVCVLLASCTTDGSPTPLRTPQLRGVIEAFYGEPYTFEDREAVFASLPASGFTTYFYGPKDDPYHRASWRDPYPEAYLAHFAELVALGEAIGVRFVFTVSPGLSFDPATNDLALLEQKLDALVDRGVRDFCIFFDDLGPASAGGDPEVQVAMLTAVRAHLRARDRTTTLCFTPPYYFGTAETLARGEAVIYPFALPDSSAVHYAAYEALPDDIAIFWTGPGVFASVITEAQLTAYRAFVDRQVFLWDNFPVNDTVLDRELFLGPYLGRSASLGTAIDGVVLNLARQPRASAIAISTAGAALGDAEAYDPTAAHAATIDALGGPASAALMRLAEHCASHPLVASPPEAMRFASLAAAYLEDLTPASEAALRAELVALAEVHDTLARDLPDARLAAELAPFAAKLSALAGVGLTALDAHAAALAGGAVDLPALDAAYLAAHAPAPIVGANTGLPAFLQTILGDGTPATVVDAWQVFFDAIRQAIVAADALH